LENFLFFRIQIQHFEFHRFETGRNRYRAGPVPPVPAVSGPVPAGSVNPGHELSLNIPRETTGGLELRHAPHTSLRLAAFVPSSLLRFVFGQLNKQFRRVAAASRDHAAFCFRVGVPWIRRGDRWQPGDLSPRSAFPRRSLRWVRRVPTGRRGGPKRLKEG
jgi:hypothetical protein